MNCSGRSKIVLYFAMFTNKNHDTILLTLKYTHIKNWNTVQKQLFIKISLKIPHNCLSQVTAILPEIFNVVTNPLHFSHTFYICHFTATKNIFLTLN